MTKFYIGTAGWSYLKWDKEFYPKGTKTPDKLGYYASQFNSVELNSSFYHLPNTEQFAAWAQQVPRNFRFAVKAPQYITHTKKLKGIEAALEDFLNVVAQKKVGPVLFQLPPKLGLDIDRLETFLTLLPAKLPCTIEFRDASWHNHAVFTLLERKNVAFCMYETAEAISPKVITADFAYVRLLGRDAPHLENALNGWREWLENNSAQAYVYFNNHDNKRLAFGNALQFQKLVTESNT